MSLFVERKERRTATKDGTLTGYTGGESVWERRWRTSEETKIGGKYLAVYTRVYRTHSGTSDIIARHDGGTPKQRIRREGVRKEPKQGVWIYAGESNRPRRGFARCLAGDSREGRRSKIGTNDLPVIHTTWYIRVYIYIYPVSRVSEPLAVHCTARIKCIRTTRTSRTASVDDNFGYNTWMSCISYNYITLCSLPTDNTILRITNRRRVTWALRAGQYFEAWTRQIANKTQVKRDMSCWIRFFVPFFFVLYSESNPRVWP